MSTYFSYTELCLIKARYLNLNNDTTKVYILTGRVEHNLQPLVVSKNHPFAHSYRVSRHVEIQTMNRLLKTELCLS